MGKEPTYSAQKTRQAVLLMFVRCGGEGAWRRRKEGRERKGEGRKKKYKEMHDRREKKIINVRDKEDKEEKEEREVYHLNV